ncbi:MAG: hypothetical protein M1536_00200 [Firmicutes bacterium]|nr:hypothetical protein [Bacillota bacterium]
MQRVLSSFVFHGQYWIFEKQDVIRETSAVWGNPPLPATPTTDYILAGSMAGPLGFKQPGNPNLFYHYSHSDGQGSVMGLTDDSGAITDQYQYEAWGNPANLPNPPPNQTYNPYHYTGQQVDPSTGLYYLRNRYYDAQAGRFISENVNYFLGNLFFFLLPFLKLPLNLSCIEINPASERLIREA